MNENFQTAIDAGKALGAPVTPQSEKDIILVPTGYEAKAAESLISQYLPTPRRTKASVRLETADSFIRYVDAYKTEETRIFVTVPDNAPPSFLAVIDYHRSDKNGARWGDHKAHLVTEFSEEWNRITRANKQKMDQVAFATFLEENAELMTTPKGAELLELVATLEGHNNISVSSAIKLSNGKVKMAYEEDVVLKGGASTQSGEIEFPQRLQFGVEVLSGGQGFYANARLRYRIENRKVTFWYELIDVHLIIRDVVKGVIAQITEKLKIEPFNGTP